MNMNLDKPLDSVMGHFDSPKGMVTISLDEVMDGIARSINYYDKALASKIAHLVANYFVDNNEQHTSNAIKAMELVGVNQQQAYQAFLSAFKVLAAEVSSHLPNYEKLKKLSRTEYGFNTTSSFILAFFKNK